MSNKVSGKVIQTSNLALAGTQDIVFAQNGIWDMDGNNLTLDQFDGGGFTSTVYTGCGTLTNPGGILPTVNVIATDDIVIDIADGVR